MNNNDKTASHTRTSRADNIKEIFVQTENILAPLLAVNPRSTMARLLVMAAKLQEKEVLKDDSLIRAKMAAKLVQDMGCLDGAIWQILLAIEANDKRFFIDFGKCLSGEITDATVIDKRDQDIAEIILFNPEMSARDAIRELKKRGHREITEDNFRMWKMRMLKGKPDFDKAIAHWHNKFSQATVTDTFD